MRDATIAIHSGYDVDPTTKAVAVPIYQTVAYAFDSADHGAALFNLEVDGFRYSRISNPTTAVLERRVAALEGGVDALCVSSGQAALNYAVLNVTGLGTNIVSVPQLYGTTYTLFAHLLPSQGITVHGGRFPWRDHARRFPMFNEPDASYHGLVYVNHFGAAAYIARCRSVYQRTTGAVLSPLSAFLLLQGIETVALRVERHVENARRVAECLRADRRVDWVNYAGFAESPYHALAQKYFGGRACSLLTFGLKGGFESSKKFYDALGLVKRLVNMGDAKSLACHPASTTHRQMSVEEQRKAGVSPEMIRLSVGIEHVDDIIADLDQALEAMEGLG